MSEAGSGFVERPPAVACDARRAAPLPGALGLPELERLLTDYGAECILEGRWQVLLELRHPDASGEERKHREEAVGLRCDLLAALRRRESALAEARAALAWYADAGNYRRPVPTEWAQLAASPVPVLPPVDGYVEEDRGQRARAWAAAHGETGKDGADGGAA